MRILFFPYECTPFHASTLEERALGGIESATIHLAFALSQIGHEVFVISSLTKEDKTNSISFPRYLSIEDAEDLSDLDVVVAVRGFKATFYNFDVKKRILWTGDAWDCTPSMGIGDKRVVSYLDSVFLVSDWQRQTLCDFSGYPPEKTKILRNGIDLSLFDRSIQKKGIRLIYTSNPARGLKYLPKIYKELKEKHENIELHVYNSLKTYTPDWNNYQDEEIFTDLYSELKALPDCFLHGSLIEKDLSKEFMKASIFVYPCDFEETSCISAMQAQAAGCPIVTSNLAALKETVGDAGILIDDLPMLKDYNNKFIAAVDTLLSDPILYQEYSKKALEQVKGFDWKIRAHEFIKLVNSEI